MTYIGELILIAVNILMAWYHADLIKDDKKIRHGLWGFLYIVLAAVMSYLNSSVWLFITALYLRKVVFDISLNLFRDLPVFYISPELKNMSFRQAVRKASIIDWIHYRLFKDRSEVYVIIYFLKLIFLNIFFL